VFIRNLKSESIDRLRKDRLFTDKLKPDIEKGLVFPAARASRVDFYHKGGKLFSYQRKFFTHKKYASAIKSDSDYVSESDLQRKVEIIKNFFDGYEQIKENCSLYSGVEAEGVSQIYHRYPFLKSDLDIVVLDIEISLKAKSEGKVQDRIDILLFNKNTGQLRFCEAKHYSNSELWAMKGAKPRVVSQIQRYEGQFQGDERGILSQYRDYVAIMNSLFNSNLPDPKSIDEKVTLLVFGYDIDQQKGRLRSQLLEDGSLAGIQHYFIGNISAVKITNMWKAAKC